MTGRFLGGERSERRVSRWLSGVVMRALGLVAVVFCFTFHPPLHLPLPTPPPPQKAADGLVAELADGRLQLSACSERAVRVLFTPPNGAAPAPSLAVVHHARATASSQCARRRQPSRS